MVVLQLACDQDHPVNSFRPSPPSYQAQWRRVIGMAVQAGVPVPGFTASLSYFDTYRRDRLPANLVQV